MNPIAKAELLQTKAQQASDRSQREGSGPEDGRWSWTGPRGPWTEVVVGDGEDSQPAGGALEQRQWYQEWMSAWPSGPGVSGCVVGKTKPNLILNLEVSRQTSGRLISKTPGWSSGQVFGSLGGKIRRKNPEWGGRIDGVVSKQAWSSSGRQSSGCAS